MGKGGGTKRREEVRRREGEDSDTFYPAGKWVVSFSGLRWRFTCAEQGVFLFIRRKSCYSSRTRQRLCFNLFPRLNAIKWSFKTPLLLLNKTLLTAFRAVVALRFFFRGHFLHSVVSGNRVV